MDGHPVLIKNEELRINRWCGCLLKPKRDDLLSLRGELWILVATNGEIGVFSKVLMNDKKQNSAPIFYRKGAH